MRSGVAVSGTVPAGDGGAAVEVDELISGPDPSWTAVTVLHALSNDSFAGTVHTTRTGPLTLRAVLQGSQASSATSSPPAVSITVYRRSIATLYGPGFYGHRTACGTILRRHTIGVANRTLPCGTPVQIYYKGSVITVPVIDRGPYAHDANWDLTMATARVLNIPGTVTIGAAAVPSATSGSGTTTSTTAGSTTPSAQ